MKKSIRSMYQAAELAGCKILDITQNKHLKIRAQRPDGTEGQMIASASSSDHRFQQNLAKQWRHFAAGSLG